MTDDPPRPAAPTVGHERRSASAVDRQSWDFRASPQALHQSPTVACLGEQMGQPTAATAAPDKIPYMDAAASTAEGVDYKQRFFASLDVRAGQTVADIGCGPGTDLARLADAAGDGSVIGVDREPRMLDERAAD